LKSRVKLAAGEGRIERRGASAASDCQKCRQHFRTVRQYQRYAIAAAETVGI
jgi:hypothetical protein